MSKEHFVKHLSPFKKSLLAAVLFVPGLQTLFAVADLTLFEIGGVLACAAFPTVLIQAQKILREGRT